MGSAQNYKVARELALMEALEDLGSSLGAEISSLTKEFEEETGSDTDIDLQKAIKNQLAEISLSGFKVIQIEEQMDCLPFNFCSYVLIGYPLAENINVQNELNYSNIKKNNKIRGAPFWYFSPQTSDEHSYYFAGFGNHRVREKAINIAVITAFKTLQTSLNGRISSLVNVFVDQNIQTNFDEVTRITSDNFLSNKFITLENPSSDEFCKYFSFDEDFEKIGNMFEYYFIYECVSKVSDNSQGITVVGKIPQDVLYHYKKEGLENLIVNEQENGGYNAYVLIKHDIKEFNENKTSNDQEFKLKLKNDAYKKLEEEMSRFQEETSIYDPKVQKNLCKKNPVIKKVLCPGMIELSVDENYK